ncbi:unnamed protein product [Adineta ricciae]|uniref:BPTI/Kunitz inhibitor domain-containing protein n=1 Tax=Adineta ricciae TaxID=249248 RepID=A0A816D3Y5_ADIRI|nr:unnamed protein product [Adineta ricciae]
MNTMLATFILISCSVIILINSDRPAECELPSKTGPCRAMFPSFYFNSTTEQCHEFVYGGCDGNGNRFETKDECLRHCVNQTTRTD